MSFTGNENHDISLEEAAAWTANYRNSDQDPTKIIAHAFGQSAIKDILNQPLAVGLRIYYALDDSGNKQLIVVGVDADGNDLYEGLLAERSFKCPPDCSAINPLNN